MQRWSLALLITGRSLAAHAVLGLRYDRSPGDPVGQGRSQTLTTPFVAATPSGSAGQVSVVVAQGDHRWDLRFAAPEGAPLVRGGYPDAVLFGTATPAQASLSVSGDGRSCQAARGWFQVREYELNASSQVVRLAVDFVQHCDATDPPLYGALRVQSVLPLNVPDLQAVAGHDIGAAAGDTVTLDGSQSLFASPSAELGLRWVQLEGPARGVVRCHRRATVVHRPGGARAAGPPALPAGRGRWGFTRIGRRRGRGRAVATTRLRAYAPPRHRAASPPATAPLPASPCGHVAAASSFHRAVPAHRTRRITTMLKHLLAAALATSCGLFTLPATAQQGTIKAKIVGFNDFHGNLQSPGTFGRNTGVPSAERPPVGGADYLAGYVAQVKAANRHTAIVGAGDFIGATPLISALFFDEPAVETLNRIGLDFIAVGNHEFDRGSAELKRLQSGGCKLTNGLTDPNSCRGAEVGTPVPFEGARFQWLSANVIEKATGKPLLPPVGIRRFGTASVAFIGMTLEGTPGIVTPTGVAGLEFKDEAETVNALVPKLRRAGIEAIVVLLHQGGFQGGAGNNSDINGCVGDLAGSELAGIVARLDNAVDLVISGHTHAAYNCSATTLDNGTTARPTGLPNATGRLVPVTSASAFGRVLTEVDIEIDRRTKDIVAVRPLNRLVDRTLAGVKPDEKVKAIVDAYNLLQAPLANSVIGAITQDLPNTANAAGEQPAGLMIADAQLAATQPAALGGAVMAFMNPGGVRNPGFLFAGSAAGEGNGNITYGEAFTVQPFGNSLVTMTLTGQQLKDLLEQQFPGCLGQGTRRILQISNGVRYSVSESAAPCSKVVDLSFTPTDVTVVPPVATGPAESIVSGGVVLNPTRTYRVTVNNFLATGGDGFTVLQGGQDVLGGAQDIDALVAYLANYKAPAAAYDPAAPALAKPRVTALP